MNYYQQHQSDYVEGLKAFLRIPSISALSEHKPDIRRAADFALNELRAAGMTSAELIEGDGNPLVYAEWLGAPGKPTILFYGHYDVQPPDPLEEWKSPPFEPEVRGEDIFARSAKEREAWARLPFDVQEYTEKEMGARELVGEPEVPLFERVWARPTLEVHGIRGGFTGCLLYTSDAA